MTSHQQRLLTGTALGFVLAALIFLASSVVQAMAVTILSWVALHEFWAMFWSGRKWLKLLGLVLAVAVVLVPSLGGGLGEVMLASLWLVGLFYLFGGQQTKDMSLADVALVLLGLIYIPAGLQFLLVLSTKELIYVLVAVFASDTAAFYGGSRWGKRKLCPSISPKKTWMGSLCSMGACVLISLCLGLIWGQATWAVWILAGVVLNLGAQAGDLFESGLKRELGIKDSGGLLPGHGGVLDRIDSLLLAVPVYMVITWVYPLFDSF